MPKLKSLLILFMALSLVAGCQRHRKADVNTLSGLYGVGASSNNTGFRVGSGLNNIRNLALEELGLSLGAQSGLQARGRYINRMLDGYSRDLDRTYNFHAMLLEHNVLPPVLLDGHNTINIDKPHLIRLTDRTYTIGKQARFVTAPPNWREYLIMEYRKPEEPHPSVLPKTTAERKVWNSAIRKGWLNGMRQADSIFADNLARLQQDFEGMVLYRKLLAQGMVSAPFVAKLNLGVTGDTDRLDINDQVLHITAMPTMQIDSTQWKAAVTPDAPPQLAEAHTDPARARPGKLVGPDIVISQHVFRR